jgi:formylglycine-generating enzyme required for sulfatase activity
MRAWLVLILLLAAALPAQAQRNLAVDKPAAAEKRVALVIGNAAYGASPLKNPVNDARAIAAKLQKLGFDVVKRENLTTKQIGATLREFRSRLSPGSEALFFYAGHGVQVKGVNYLPAVDADITSEEDVPNQSINVSQLLEIMDDTRTRLNLIFLDACRNNPFTRRFRSTGGGLAKIEAPSGTKISFATRPGSVAADGEGRNGLYTEHLLRVMDERGLPIEQALKRVYSGVKQASKGAQEPWEEGTIEGEFYFQPAAPGQTTQLAQLTAQPVGARTTEQIEDELWDAIRDSEKIGVFEEYLRQYPNGRYLAQARVKLAGLREVPRPAPMAASAAVSPAPTPTASAGPVFKDCDECPEMVTIPAGSFEMGDGMLDSDKPVHRVTIPAAFALGRTEVTQAQWRAMMGNNPSRFADCGDDCPVENVSWDDVQHFVRKISQKTGKAYRLPSEAEWEYACRAGARQWYCGSDNVAGVAWHDAFFSGATHRVAGKQANAWQLHDMSGNVTEWVEDCWHGNYEGAPNDGSAWASGNCEKRVTRGGSWAGPAHLARAARRDWAEPATRNSHWGFRLAQTLVGAAIPGAQQTPPEQNAAATLCFFRTPQFVNGQVTATVEVDRTKVGQLKNSDAFCISRPAGTYAVSGYGLMPPQKTISVTAQPGKTVYVKVEYTWFGGWETSLASEQDGQQEVAARRR